MKTIESVIDARGINKFQNALNKYVGKMDSNMEKLGEKLAEEGVSIARGYLSEHIDTGETIASVRAERQSDNSTSILVNGAATWLEFGTGTTYNRPGNYPLQLPKGIYDIGQYGQGHGKDKGGWFYYIEAPTKNGGKTRKRRHTLGIPATHFLYNTSRDLQDPSVLQKIADEVFR